MFFFQKKPVAFIALLVSRVNAESFELDMDLEGYTLKMSRVVALSASQENPAEVRIDVVKALPAPTEGLDAVSLAIVKQGSFEEKISKDDFCCDDANTKGCVNGVKSLKGSDNRQGPAYSAFLFGKSKQSSVKIYEEGLYYVGVVTCQETGKPKLMAKVTFRSSHGYLSATDYPAVSFMGWLSCVYAAVLGVWIYLCLKWRDALVNMHFVLGGLAAVSLATALAKYLSYVIRNGSVEPSALALLGSSAAMFRFGVACVVGIMIALGYGTAHDSVSSPEFSWLILYLLLFSGFASMRLLITGTADPDFIETPFLEYLGFTKPQPLGGELPVEEGGIIGHLKAITVGQSLVLPEGIVFGSMANWGYISLCGVEEVLRSQKQHETLKTMNTFHLSLKFAVTGIVLLCLANLYNASSGADSADKQGSWRSYWLYDEAGPEAIYAAVLLLTLHAFLPNEHFKTKVMSQQINFEDAELDDMMDDNAIGNQEIEMTEGGDKKYLE